MVWFVCFSAPRPGYGLKCITPDILTGRNLMASKLLYFVSITCTVPQVRLCSICCLYSHVVFWLLHITSTVCTNLWSSYIYIYIYHMSEIYSAPITKRTWTMGALQVSQMLKHWEKKQKSTNVKSLTKIVWFQQFSELDRISHGADVVGQSVPGGRTRMWERPLAKLRAQPW